MKAAIIGICNMGKNHVRVYSEISSITLVALSDLNETLGTQLAEKHHTKFYRDYEEMLEKEEIDLVSVCVPTSLHFKVASYCLKKKVHTLLEKPITSNINDAQKLINLAKRNKVKLLVGHIERYNPALRQVKEIVDSGILGRIIAITSRRVGGFPPQIKDVDVAVDLAIHDIDISNYLLGELPTNISVNKQLNHTRRRPDSVEFFLKYKRASSYIQANWISPVKIRKLNITGSEGYLEMDYISQKIEIYKSNYSKFKEESSNFSDYVLLFSEPDITNVSVKKKEPLKEEILFFIDCIKNNIDLDSLFALKALEISLKK